jgi:hypothetical protein
MITATVDQSDVAEHFWGSPEDMLDVLAIVATHLSDINGAKERFIRRFRSYHCASEAHCMVAPLLRQLADALNEAEAGFQ